MTQVDLNTFDIFDLYDMLVTTMNELFALDNSPKNAPAITEKKERLLVLQNAIQLKKLEM